MNLFKKKLQFYCKLPEVKEKYPIIKATSYKPQWFKNSSIAYKDEVKHNGIYQHVSGTIKCNGIRNILSQGYILKSWFDLTIRTGDSDTEFQFIIPPEILKYLEERNFNKPLISWFSAEDKHVTVPIQSNSLQTLIKLVTPWSVSIPSGWSLMFLPIPYPDDPEFSTTHGILTGGDVFEINPILAWHKRPGDHFIPAGTPLCQMIPIKDQSLDIELLNYDQKMIETELRWQFNIGHKFIRDYK
jgi:hypothetical protein